MMLPAIAKVVNKRVTIIFDSGVRRGSHVFKALASGADVVAVGRPVLYGLNLGGSEGVKSVIEHFNRELKINMFLSGARNINDVKKFIFILMKRFLRCQINQFIYYMFQYKTGWLKLNLFNQPSEDT